MKEKKNYVVANLSIILLLIAMALSNVVFAQPGGGQQGPPELPNAKQIKKMVAEMSEELSLNEEQGTEILELYTAHFDEVKELTSAGRPDRTKMEAVKTKLEKQVKALLTEEQQELYVAYVKEHEPSQEGGERPSRD
jgi:Spy/CpxP family protein refolding chaperone